MRALYYILLTLALLTTSAGCSGSHRSTPAETAAAVPQLPAPQFDADSALVYVGEQTGFGPRVPGSESHRKAVNYLTEKLKSFNPDTVILQRATVDMPDGKPAEITNILGRWGSDRKKKILLLAHYDSRPTADEDPDPANRSKPIDGANDGASGVGVLLEIARQLSLKLPENNGIDILFVDAEDSGKDNDEDSWCIGTQYWAKNLPYGPTGKPQYGILLDMVGGKDARFHREYFSNRFARPVVDKVWSRAAVLGYGSRFPNETGGAITDDHLPLNRAGIPTIDIIENKNAETGSFNPTWHTLDDNFDNIDVATLEIVGKVVSSIIYNQ